MKQSIPLLLVLILISGCNNHQAIETKSPAKDINDLGMTTGVQKIYSARRQALLKTAGEGVIILRSDYGFSGGRNEFRAANNFVYLTGFSQPGSLMVLKDGPGPFTLYVKEKTINEAIFTGDAPEASILKNTYLADEVQHYQDLGKMLNESIISKTPVYIDFDDPLIQGYLLNIASNKEVAAKLFKNIGPAIYEMRVKKDDHETAILQKAIDITGEAFTDVLHSCEPGMHEFEVEALIEYAFRRNGASMPAFQSVVGSGANALCLHYSINTRRMDSGDLLLMDFGADYGYYCGDISRTIPVDGKFTPEQKVIYELVLKAQKAAIEEMIPGKSINAGHNKSARILVHGLYNLGLITDTASEWQKKFYLLYPISHYLGMDVHDAGGYGTTYSELYKYVTKDTVLGRPLESGMVLTVEPGLYFRSNGLSQLFELFGTEASREEIQVFIDKVTPVYTKYKNIGIRIEDDVMITDEGNIVLSKNIPKEIAEIESHMIRASDKK